MLCVLQPLTVSDCTSLLTTLQFITGRGRGLPLCLKGQFLGKLLANFTNLARVHGSGDGIDDSVGHPPHKPAEDLRIQAY